MISGRLWTALWLFLWLPSGGMAAEVSGLYEAEVTVFSQKRSERATAMVSALAEVLAKVSGRRDAAMLRGVARDSKRPAHLLQQYRYRAVPTDSADAEDGAQMLLFRFDKAAVDKVLRDNGLPVWGATRPSSLVWLAVEDEGRRYLVGEDSPEPVQALLMAEAKRRGLAVRLPLMDLQDQQALRFGDIWGGFSDVILRASRRYRTEAVLVGRLYRPADGDWQAQWTLLEGQDMHSWAGNGVLSAEVIDIGVAGAIETLASRYAPTSGQGRTGQLSLTVAEVRTLSDYARVSRYLASLQQVTGLQASRVAADRVTFELDVESGPEAIAQIIALGDVLVPLTPDAYDSGDRQVNMFDSGFDDNAQRTSPDALSMAPVFGPVRHPAQNEGQMYRLLP
ncbi:MAG: DUF2066 domain-containing protein [Gammaproteobacteria bacterium]|nr:DUF2066 domain-containing protein [Gammaproteobacteria bacterium]